MKNKLLMTAGLVVGSMLTLPAAFADTATLYQNGGYSFADGGEFTTYTTPDNFLEYYVPNTIVNGGFETFCVEQSVFFNPGVTYNFTESDTDSEGRPLTEGAAYLYFQFAKGNLAGYDYTGPNRSGTAGELQAALWWVQGNQIGGGFPTGGAGNPFYDQAVDALGANRVTAPNNDTYDVAIMELWDANGDTHQNQLVISGVPDGGTTVGLLGIAALGLLACRRQGILSGNKGTVV